MDSDHLQSLTKKRYAFLDSLLFAHYKDPKLFSEKDILDQVQTIMFEGHDTTSSQLDMTFLLVASDQRIQVNRALTMNKLIH